MEQTLFQFGEDVIFTGHVHAYERTHPVFGMPTLPSVHHPRLHPGFKTSLPWLLVLEYMDEICSPEQRDAPDMVLKCQLAVVHVLMAAYSTCLIMS